MMDDDVTRGDEARDDACGVARSKAFPKEWRK